MLNMPMYALEYGNFSTLIFVDNISNPRFPKSSGGFSTRQYYQKRFYYVFDTFSLEVTPNSLVLRLGHAFD